MHCSLYSSNRPRRDTCRLRTVGSKRSWTWTAFIRELGLSQNFQMSIWVRFGRVPVHCWNYLSNWQFIHFSRPANSLSKRVSTEFTTLFTELLHSWLAKTSVVAPANVQLRLQNSVTVFERTVKQITLPAQVLEECRAYLLYWCSINTVCSNCRSYWTASLRNEAFCCVFVKWWIFGSIYCTMADVDH